MQYAALEKAGIHKRDILVDRVEDAKEAQQEVKEEVLTTYEQFTQLVNVDGGELEKTYYQLKDQLENTEEAIEDVGDEIQSIEKVAADLFEEWQQELEQYNNPELRRSSQSQLNSTKKNYSEMINRMKRARGKVDPVLTVFQDQVLSLKHNLNAKALNSMRFEVDSMERKVNVLIQEMEIAIREAEQFLQSME